MPRYDIHTIDMRYSNDIGSRAVNFSHSAGLPFVQTFKVYNTDGSSLVDFSGGEVTCRLFRNKITRASVTKSGGGITLPQTGQFTVTIPASAFTDRYNLSYNIGCTAVLDGVETLIFTGLLQVFNGVND